MFERDWARACAKEKFTGMLSRENKACKSDPKEDKAMMAQVHDVLLQVIKSMVQSGSGYKRGSYLYRSFPYAQSPVL